MTKRMLSVAEAAEYIGRSPGSLRNEISQGSLPFAFVKMGRRVLIDRRDLDRWLDSLPRFGGRERQA